MQIGIKLSYKLILLILVSMARHSQITENNKFANYLRYSKILHFGSKLGPKWPKMVENEVFWTLIKLVSLMLAGITFKWWIILHSIILCKPHVCENSKMRLLVPEYAKIFEVLLNLSHQYWVESLLNDEEYCFSSFSRSRMIWKAPKLGIWGQIRQKLVPK